MDDATIRRYLTGPRLTVLAIVDRGGAGGADDVARSWRAERASLSPAHVRRLPRIAGQLLWQLANLGWIERSGGEWKVTELGRHARGLGVRHVGWGR